jgi:hypothetical protein
VQLFTGLELDVSSFEMTLCSWSWRTTTHIERVVRISRRPVIYIDMVKAKSPNCRSTFNSRYVIQAFWVVHLHMSQSGNEKGCHPRFDRRIIFASRTVGLIVQNHCLYLSMKYVYHTDHLFIVYPHAVFLFVDHGAPPRGLLGKGSS